MDVVGLGTLAMDVLMQVDRLPEADAFCVVEKTTYLPGGSGTNVIVQLARLQADCGFIGKVSDDKIGRDVLASLESEKVDSSSMVVHPGGTTLHTDIVVDRSGEKFIMLNMGDVFMTLETEEVDREYIRQGKVFYTDLLPYAAAREGLRIAKEAGLHTVFNMQAGLSTMNGCGITAEMLLDCLQYVDVFAPCRGGLYELAGTEDLDECLKFIRPYFSGEFLITLGSGGSAAFDEEDRCFRVPARKVQAVDTTGAGDSYIGGFIYSRFLQQKSLEEAMSFATACAAHTCTGLGARYSPTLAQAEAYL